MACRFARRAVTPWLMRSWASGWKKNTGSPGKLWSLLINGWYQHRKNQTVWFYGDPGVWRGTGNRYYSVLPGPSCGWMRAKTCGHSGYWLWLWHSLVGQYWGKLSLASEYPSLVQSTRSNQELNRINPQRLVVDQGSVWKLNGSSAEAQIRHLHNILAEVIIDMIWMSAIAKTHNLGHSPVVSYSTMRPSPRYLRGTWLDRCYPLAAEDWCCFCVRPF